MEHFDRSISDCPFAALCLMSVTAALLSTALVLALS